MRRLCLLILAVNSVLLLSVERLAAAPVVFFQNQPFAFPDELITHFGVPFSIDIDAGGGFSRTFQNGTGLLITDFHIRSRAPEAAVWIGGGGAPPPFFQIVIAVPEATGIDFYKGGFGSGILPGEVFEISGSGFAVNRGTPLRAVASVPEPSTEISCLAGVLALFVVSRKVARNSKTNV